jgi:hypothetical protein
MTKLNWNRPRKIYDGILCVEKKTKDINLGIHETHKLKTVLATGPHYGKLMCSDCNKFIKWLSYNEYKSINSI